MLDLKGLPKSLATRGRKAVVAVTANGNSVSWRWVGVTLCSLLVVLVGIIRNQDTAQIAKNSNALAAHVSIPAHPLGQLRVEFLEKKLESMDQKLDLILEDRGLSVPRKRQ